MSDFFREVEPSKPVRVMSVPLWLYEPEERFAYIAELIARHSRDRGGHWISCDGDNVLIQARCFEGRMTV